MAWIVVVPPSPRHPHERYQVCYQEGKRQRSAGIFPTKRRALAEQRAIERGRGELVKDHEMDLERARTLFGDYVATKWWPAWKDQHPTSEYGTRKKVEKRILPTFGDIPLIDLDASTIGAWKSAMLAEQLSPQTVNTYLSVAAGDHPERRRGRRLPGPLAPGAQERCRPHRRNPQPARAAPRGLAAA
jgi:hypothetical protein